MGGPFFRCRVDPPCQGVNQGLDVNSKIRTDLLDVGAHAVGRRPKKSEFARCNDGKICCFRVRQFQSYQVPFQALQRYTTGFGEIVFDGHPNLTHIGGLWSGQEQANGGEL